MRHIVRADAAPGKGGGIAQTERKKQTKCRSNRPKRGRQKKKQLQYERICKNILDSTGYLEPEAIDSLSGKEVDAVAWVQFDGTVLKGKVQERREGLKFFISTLGGIIN